MPHRRRGSSSMVMDSDAWTTLIRCQVGPDPRLESSFAITASSPTRAMRALQRLRASTAPAPPQADRSHAMASTAIIIAERTPQQSLERVQRTTPRSDESAQQAFIATFTLTPQRPRGRGDHIPGIGGKPRLLALRALYSRHRLGLPVRAALAGTGLPKLLLRITHSLGQAAGSSPRRPDLYTPCSMTQAFTFYYLRVPQARGTRRSPCWPRLLAYSFKSRSNSPRPQSS